MMSNLPQDLLAEILFLLPATALSQLQYTCKRWYNLINDRLFSILHSDRSKKQSLVLMLTEKYRLSLLNINLYNEVPSDLDVNSGLTLMDHSNSYQVDIFQVSHCDGLLLCTIRNETRIVVWNPCTGQTKWIQTGKNRCYLNFYDFVLGYYQDKKSGDESYKILSFKNHNYVDQEFEMYDINSDSWRILDVTPIPHYRLTYSHYRVSLKGKAYWFGYDDKEEHIGLNMFDYTTDRLDCLSLPCKFKHYKDLYLSVVGEEKLSVVLQRPNTKKKEIWVTNKINDETKEFSWNKLMEVKDFTGYDISFLFDQEMRIVLNCWTCLFSELLVLKISIVDEDNEVTQVSSTIQDKSSSFWPYFYNYVPSLAQIQ